MVDITTSLSRRVQLKYMCHDMLHPELAVKIFNIVKRDIVFLIHLLIKQTYVLVFNHKKYYIFPEINIMWKSIFYLILKYEIDCKLKLLSLQQLDLIYQIWERYYYFDDFFYYSYVQLSEMISK